MKRSVVPYLVISCVLVLLCCLCGIILVSTGIISWVSYNPTSQTIEFEEELPQPTPVVIRPEESLTPILYNTQDALENTNVPFNDLLDLARRLEGKENIPVALDPVTSYYQVGASQSFWISNTDTNENFQIEATLQYVTEHVYFWIENGVRFNRKDLRNLAETFEYQIYPTDRTYFGSEWTPGVDGDPHIYIIYAKGLGSRLAGAFSSADEYSPLAHEYSNMHETFVLSADNQQLRKDYTYGVLAHEFQHMIHWYQDRNEDTWVNEGFSELASFINGYDVGGFDYLYVGEPDLQLNDWSTDPDGNAPHYGASFLFMVYLLDRFGPATIRTLVQNPQNGMSSIDAVLSTLDTRDILTGEVIGADDVFLDWTLANYLNDKDIPDGRYAYHNYADAPQTGDTEAINRCPTEVNTRDVSQYGVDYIRIDCAGDFNLHFEGSVAVGLLPADPHSGDFAFWSNKGDDSDMTLTRTFDFQDYSGPLTFSYWTWYDIEADFDYVYLEASTDGKAWEILTTPAGTPEDPTGNSFGWGYSGLSGNGGSWIQEQVDISRFAGEQVTIRFEYVTDGAVFGEGFLIDDITIPEVGYATGFEEDADGWEAAGFVRIQNVLSQTFRLAVILDGRTTQVATIDLEADNTVDIPLHLGDEVDNLVLVVTGTTRFTRLKASYQFQVTPE
jgi:immune inhibitor A